MHFYELANHLEAVLWTTMGVGFFVYLPWTPRAKRGRCVLAAVVLIAFGASDIFDAESGAGGLGGCCSGRPAAWRFWAC